jgi:hypothetical protein
MNQPPNTPPVSVPPTPPEVQDIPPVELNTEEQDITPVELNTPTFPNFRAQPHKIGFIYRKLLSVAGVDHRIIVHCASGEIHKHAAMGAAIVLVAVLAFFSGAYAIYAVFEDQSISIALGLVWAILIFNLDRLLVLSSPKKEEAPVGVSQREKVLYGLKPILSINLWIRLGMAIILSIAISKPLELRMMSSAIEQQLLERKRSKTANLEADVEKIRQKFQVSIDQIEQQKAAETAKYAAGKPESLLEAERNLEKAKEELRIAQASKAQRQQQINAEQRMIANEWPNASEQRRQALNSRQAVLNQQLQSIIAERLPQEQSYDAASAFYQSEQNRYGADYQRKMQDLNHQLKQLQDKRDQEINDAREDAQQGRGLYSSTTLVDRITALSDAEADNPTLHTMGLFLMLMFIVLEISPILAKTFMPPGEYDFFLRRDEEAAKLAYENQLEEKQKLQQLISDREVFDQQLEYDRLRLAVQQEDDEQQLAHKQRLENIKQEFELFRSKQEFLFAQEQEYRKLLDDIQTAADRKEKAELEQQIQDTVKMTQEINQARIEAEVMNNRKILQAISNAHLEIVKEQVEKWMEQQKEELRKRKG